MLDSKKDYKAWLYLGIPLFLLTVFTFYPLINTIMISFFSDYDSTMHNYGNVFNIEAYKAVLNNKFFRGAIVNTLLIVFISVPVSTIIALLIAVSLNSIKPLQKFFQIIFFTPYVTNVLAIGMVFATMFFHPARGAGIRGEGLINSLFGLTTDWVGSNADKTHWMFVVIFYIIWNALPFKILVFIGGLQNISKQYYDAAKIDSSTPRRTLFRLTVPLLSPMISYVLITSFIGSFKTYESVLAVAGTENGLARDRLTIVAYVYQQIGMPYESGVVSEYSKGAAGAVLLFLIILVFTAFNLYVSKKRVHY